MTTILHQIVVEMVTKGGPGGVGSGGSGATSHGGAIASELKNAESSVSHLGEMLKGTIGGMADAFTGAVEKVGKLTLGLTAAAGMAGVGGLVYGVTHLNKELEATNISLASVFQAQGFAPTFAGATEMAKDQVAKMKTDIRTLPGDLGNLTNAMSQLASPAGLAGANADQIRQLSGKTLLASSILLGSRFGTQQSLEVGTREMAMILAGHAGGRNDLANVMPGIAGHAHELSQMTPEQRLVAVNKALDALTKDSAQVFGTSWTAVYTTLLDNFKYKLLAPTTAPLFEHIKADIIKVNDWFAANDMRVQRFAQVLGDDLAAAWDKGVSLAYEWGPVVVGFAKDVRQELEIVWLRFGPSLSEASAALKDALQNGSALHEIEKILKFYGAVKIGSPILSTSSSVFGALGGAKSFSGALGSADAAMGLAGAGAAAGLLAIAALGAAGALHAAADSTSQYHDDAVRGIKDVTRSFDHLTDQLELHVVPSLEALGTKSLPLVSKLLDMSANAIGGQAALYSDPAGFFADTMRAIGRTASQPGEREFFNKFADVISPKLNATPGLDSPDRDRILDVRSSGPLAEAIRAETAARKAAPKVPPGLGGTHIQKVQIVSSSNADPSRVATILFKKVVDLSRHPKISPDVPDFSSSR